MMMKKVQILAASAVAAGLALASPVVAEEAREFAWSVTGAGTSDYVFRGISQTAEDPAFQASIDATYGIFYAGIWGSNIDLDVPGFVYGSGEIDFYAGIKPVLGPVTFDLGILYYYYPGSEDGLNGAESDYVEFKLGASMSPFENASVGAVYYYSPDNFGEAGTNHAIEGTIGYTLPAFGIFTPTISGTLGYVNGELGDPQFLVFDDANDDDYVYWNAGIAFVVEKFTFDFRYHDTDIDQGTTPNFFDIADERFVATVKVTLP